MIHNKCINTYKAIGISAIEKMIKITSIFLIFGALYSCGSIERLIMENESYNSEMNIVDEELNDEFNQFIFHRGYYIDDFHLDGDSAIYNFIDSINYEITTLTWRINERSSFFECIKNIIFDCQIIYYTIVNNEGDAIAIKPVSYPHQTDLECLILKLLKTKYIPENSNSFTVGSYKYKIEFSK